MSSRIVTFCLSLTLYVVTSFSVASQQVILNGDFSSGLTSWTLVQPPGNIIVAAQPGSFDVANSGPLSGANSFYAHIGNDSPIGLQQTVVLSAGVTYNLFANIADSTPMYNVDGGTISAFIDGNSIGSHSFGADIGQFATLVGAYTPLHSGDAVLSLDFSRGYIADQYSPTDWIDNIALTAVPEPSAIALCVCVGILLRVKMTQPLRTRHSVITVNCAPLV
jgi:hypothetical protein